MQLATIEGLKLVTRTSVDGKKLGQRLAFHGQGTPADMRKAYKAAGMKGSALSKAVREAVKGGKDIAWVSFHALAQMAQNGDYVPTQGDINSKGDKIKLELVKPTEPKRKVKDDQTIADAARKLAIEALVAATGVTVEVATAMLDAKAGTPAIEVK
jgi:hypothetical protein